MQVVNVRLTLLLPHPLTSGAQNLQRDRGPQNGNENVTRTGPLDNRPYVNKLPIATTLLFVFLSAVALGQQPTNLQVSAKDAAGKPVSSAQVLLRQGSAIVAVGETDAAGSAQFQGLKPGSYDLEATKQGYLALQQKAIAISASGVVNLDLVFSAGTERRDSVDVNSTLTPAIDNAAGGSEIKLNEARELPSRPATITDVLPLIPGIVRSPEGGLKISGAGEHRSALIVNSVDATDPATGQFGPTIPIDSVETLTVFQTPFLAQYGRFTSGLVSVETKRGGDKWKYDVNDPFPDFRFRSWHLAGIRDATPRLNFSGPLMKDKLYFSQGVEYEIRKTPVITLAFPLNEQKIEGFNSFSQLDYLLSSRQILTATFHVAPQRRNFVNLSYFNPEEVSPNSSSRNYAGAIADHAALKSGLLENTLAITRFDANVWGNGTSPMVLTPTGNTGSYFAAENRGASRIEWLETYSPNLFGGSPGNGHQLKFGTSIARTDDDGQFRAHSIRVQGPQSQLLQQIDFSGGSPFERSDLEMSFFGQDHWLLRPNLALDYGLRAETQRVTGSFRFAPRFGFAWTPFESLGTVVRGGYGLFYDRVPLNVYEFDRYPEQSVTGPDGTTLVYRNIIGQVLTKFPFVDSRAKPGNFSPHSETYNLQIDQPAGRYLKLRASFLSNNSSDLITLSPIVTATSASLVLDGNGHSRYRQFELTARLRLGEETRQLFFSYVHSRIRGDLNDFNEYLGSYPVPIIRPNQFAYLPGDLPNRFLAYGLVRMPGKFQIAPILEYRNGFPYLITNAAQQYSAIPNAQRFPNFLSLDARLSKDFQVNPKYTVRLSVSGFNLTNHFNPDTVHGNIADPRYGIFFGQHKRRYTADFDIIF